VDAELTRRRLLELGLALPPLAAVLADAADASAAPLEPTAACEDGDEPTDEQSEGPFFTPRSPRRRSLLTPELAGTRLTLIGYVLTTRCRPIRGALLDFWQADARGVYDNDGYRLRGHQLTGRDGSYRLETIVPGLYSGRTRHIHVKVRAPGRPLLTTQLYFPGVTRNRVDGLFDRSLLVSWRRVGARRIARFDFVLD
jgi:protocatechuate 3,4-dioxygenase beta subunit